MARRNFLPQDIVEISYLNLPVARKMKEPVFSARITSFVPIISAEEIPKELSVRNIHSSIDRKDWCELWWEQRSNKKRGCIVVPADGQTVSWLPRVRLLKRPR